jgi:peptidoglycan-associated lipoprotein
MRRTTSSPSFIPGLVLLVAPLLAGGCAHKQPIPPATPPTSSMSMIEPAPKTATVPSTATCNSDDQCDDNQLCLSGTCQAINGDTVAQCMTVTHFDFNQDIIRPEDRTHLQRTARCMKVMPGLQVTVAGNCDERGTEEYNLALGDRRANSVASYLESLGVPANDVQTVSYGKLRPVCEAHQESCWWHNRRATVERNNLSAQR